MPETIKTPESMEIEINDGILGQDEIAVAREARKKKIVRIVLCVLAIVVGVLLVLYIVSRAALYNSIIAMLRDMGAALAEVIRRIFS